MAEPLRKTTDYAQVQKPAQPVQPVIAQPVVYDVTLKPAKQAYGALRFAFTVAPIVAGADKFYNYLVDWSDYLAPVVPQTLGISASTFMQGVGIIEIIAGIGVMVMPKVFGYVVSAWLLGIVGNLLIQGSYYDIALRDFGLAIGAYALARLANQFDRRRQARLAV